MNYKAVRVIEGIAVAATAALVLTIYISGSAPASGGTVVTAENQIYLEQITFSQTMSGGDFAVVTAQLAYLNRNKDLAVLENTTLRVEGDGTLFTARADWGQYIFDKLISSAGKISGSYNELSYSAGDNGTFVYDFTDGKGVLRENITVRQKGFIINADTLYFDYAENSILFDGDVTLSVEPGGV
jgi:hypothetical protein